MNLSFIPKAPWNHGFLSKTDFICGDSCPHATLFRYLRPRDAVPFDMDYVLDNGKAVGEFARTLYPDAVTVEHSTPIKQATETRHFIETGKQTICEASFVADNLFCAVDVLEITEPGHVTITEVKSSTKIKDIFYRDIAFQVYVVKECGYIVDAAYLLYVDSEYVRGDTIDPEKYFIKVDVSTDVFNLQSTIENDLALLSTVAPDEPHISECCFRPYACPFWENVCSHALPENSIFDIKGGMRISTKLKHYYNDVVTMADFLKLKKQNPKYIQQCKLEVEKSDETEINFDGLVAFLDKLEMPLTSVDFETIAEALPLFPGQKPYAQTVCQFSMHILREYGKNLEHLEYLADPSIDWRGDLAHALVKCCPPKGSILVWNEAMEKNRILEFAELECNQDIKEALIDIANRILDLMVPFRERVIYNRKMKGSYSIKKVLPALCPNDNLSYDELSINNGMLASMAFSTLVHKPEMPRFEATTIKRALLTYCELDTYGPFCILNEMLKMEDKYASELFIKNEKQDRTKRTIRVGDSVSTNIGNGAVTGFTKYFVRVRLNSGRNVLRKPHNLYNMSGLDVEALRNDGNTSFDFCDVTGREVKIGDFVVTKSLLGQVTGKTKHFLKIHLSNGKDVLRNGTFVIIS